MGTNPQSCGADMTSDSEIRLIDKRSALLIVGILIGLVINQAVGSRVPVVSSAWLGFAIVGTLIVYIRARRAIRLLQEQKNALELDNADKLSRPELIADSLNQSMERQFAQIRSNDAMSDDDRAILEKVETATREDRLDLYLQPIVDINDQSIKYYEAFSRLRDENGFLLLPADYLDTVERANRIGFIDNMILLRSVQALRSLAKRSEGTAVFCNISPATLYDQSFFSLFVQYLDANADLAGQLVFEFTYPAITIVDTTIGKNLEMISERGFSFSVDHLHKFEVNQSAIKRLNVKFIKAPASLLEGAVQGAPNADIFKKFHDQLRAADIALVSEKIEGEAGRAAAKELGIQFGQGNYFGRPRPVDFYLRDESLKKAS